MEASNKIKNKLASLSQGMMAAFAASLLLSIYFLLSLPGDLQFKGGLQHLDLVSPILLKLNLSLGLTALLACVALYAEMKKTKVAIVYKEKATEQVSEEKNRSDSTLTFSLESNAISSTEPTVLISDALTALGKKLNAVSGACYISREEKEGKFVELISGYALPARESDTLKYSLGEGIVGQSAKSGIALYIDEIPEGYFPVVSGLGQSAPKSIFILPLINNKEVKGILELATFQPIRQHERLGAEKFAAEIGARLI